MTDYYKQPEIHWPDKPGRRFSIIYLTNEMNRPIDPNKPIVVFGREGENRFQLRKRIYLEVTEGKPYRAPVEREYSIVDGTIKIKDTKKGQLKKHLPEEYQENGWTIKII